MLLKSVQYGFYLHIHLLHLPWEFLKFKGWVLFIYMLIHHPCEAFVEQNKLHHYQVLLCGRFHFPKAATTISLLLHLLLCRDLPLSITSLVCLLLNLGRFLAASSNEMGAETMLCDFQGWDMNVEAALALFPGTPLFASLELLYRKEVRLRGEAKARCSV